MPKLTKSYIDALQAPADKEAFHWDERDKGFGLRITPTGKITYVAQGRIGGKTVRLSIGPHGRWTPDKARDEARNGVLRGQVTWLNRIGFGCMAVAIGSLGIGLAIGGVAAIRRVGPLAVVAGVGALLCFGTAQIVGAQWFLWAVGGVLLVLVTWFAIWAWKHQKRGDLAAELATRTAKVAAVAKTAVPVLDAAYEQADEATRRWLDAKIFDRLSSLMNRDEKATVHEIRREATP